MATMSKVKQHAYGMLATSAPNVALPTVLIRQRKFSGQNIHHEWKHERYCRISANAVTCKWH